MSKKPVKTNEDLYKPAMSLTYAKGYVLSVIDDYLPASVPYEMIVDHINQGGQPYVVDLTRVRSPRYLFSERVCILQRRP